MAKRRGNRGGGGGPAKLLMSIVGLLVVGGLIFAFAKANNISSVSSFIDWARSSSDKLDSCIMDSEDEALWKCDSPFGNGSNGGDQSNGGDSSEGNGGSTEGEAPNEDGSKGDPSKEVSALASLVVADQQKVDYNREDWKHWTGERCNDTRQQVLKAQAKSFELDSKGCKVASGEWVDPYTGKTFTDPSKLDIDHVYPLGAAARAGGQSFSAEQKEAFANDTSQLLAVSASANRSKSDKTPEEWMPENKDFTCSYSKLFVNVSAKYDLTITAGDKKALEAGLRTC